MNAIETAACDTALALVESGWTRRAVFSLSARPETTRALVASLGRLAQPEELTRFEALVCENLRWALA